MYYRKISTKERFPEKGVFVTTIDSANEYRVYRLTEHGWNMRDADGANSPNNNLPIEYWLEEINENGFEKDAQAFFKNFIENCETSPRLDSVQTVYFCNWAKSIIGAEITHLPGNDEINGFRMELKS